MRKEQGLTLTGFIITAIVVIFILLLGFKIGPAYYENYAITKQFKALAADPVTRSGTRREFEAAYVARATIENVTSVGAGDIAITKDGNEIVLSAEYSTKVPIFGNLSACMDFAPTSADK